MTFDSERDARPPNEPSGPDAEYVPVWRLSAAVPAAVAVALLLCAAGMLFSRIELVLLALPLLISAAVAWENRPRGSSTAQLRTRLSEQPDRSSLGYTIAFRMPDPAEHVQLRLTGLGEPIGDVLIGRAGAADVHGVVPLLHSGPQEFLRIEHRLIGADAGFISDTGPQVSVSRVVEPKYDPVSSLPVPPVLHGLTGTHPSRRPGDGGEFRDIHPFVPGDRLRRIDWKATARRGGASGELYVRRTTADADATVLLVLDSRDDIGENVDAWGTTSPLAQGLSSMDIARQASASLAAGYIRVGDRVGFQDLASSARAVQHGGGSRHLARLVRAIEQAGPSGPVLYRVRPPVVVTGALIYVLSTFLDDEAGRMATLWRGAGHRVIAVDVLPAARLRQLSREQIVAHRIVLMERADRVRALERVGVEVMRWQNLHGGVNRAAQLRTLSRPARAAR
ncbi:MAG TPA: DUF58 domain-containing protein [Microbacteriaceae bacterium]